MQIKFRTGKKGPNWKTWEVKSCITAFTDMKFYSTMNKIVNEMKVQKRQAADMLVNICNLQKWYPVQPHPLPIKNKTHAYARSPLIRLASWISLGMMVTLFAWMAHRLVSSNNPTKYASLASYNGKSSGTALWNKGTIQDVKWGVLYL